MDEQARIYGQENLTLPHDVVPLPSEGVFYKNRKKSLKVGYLTASDENILMAGGRDLTTNLLRNKIYEPDIRIEDLLEGDVEAILIFLRNSAFGPNMEITLTDPKTNKQFITNVSLESMTIIKGQEPSVDGTFSITLPKTNANLKIKPLTYGEILDISNMESTYPKGRVFPKVTIRLQKQIVEINGVKDLGEIAKFVEQMPISDSKYIKNFLDQNEPKLDMTKIVVTPSGENLQVNVGFGVDFFRPFF
jgi:hypothetical protein